MHRPAYLTFLGLLLVPLVLVALTTCTFRQKPRPSVLVIAIDRMGVGQVACAAPNQVASANSGLGGAGVDELCAESVRFTHAYTTSVLSAPAMASLLTGLNPIRSGLRHNGGGEFGFLSASVETVAEAAFRNGYRTLFVSGSPPFLRRTGLHQGFEVFDDALLPNSKRVHRSARGVADIFLKWLEGESTNESTDTPFFAVLHFGDLQFPWHPMLDDSGRVRESSVRGQQQEIDETLSRVWVQLKKQKRWEHTTVVLAGLQGDFGEGRSDTPPALDLHSEMAHVALLVKEGGQPGYNWVPKSWSFDPNVSLADVGLTLFDWVGETKPRQDDDAVLSLQKAMRGPGEELDDLRRSDRVIFTESGWAKWQFDSTLPVRVALRKGPYLYFHDVKGAIYNTLTDTFEVSPLPKRNATTESLRAEFEQIADIEGYRKFDALPEGVLVEERWARSYFLNQLGARTSSIADAAFALDQQRVEALSETSRAARVWLTLQKFSLPGGVKYLPASSCAKTVFTAHPIGDSEVADACPFRGAKEVAKWYREKNEDERDRIFELIYRLDQQRATAVRVAEASLALGQIWESGATRRNDLEGLEILLAQPEALRLRQKIMRRNRTQPEL